MTKRNEIKLLDLEQIEHYVGYIEFLYVYNISKVKCKRSNDLYLK